jgi:hypothetical protein
MNGPMMLEVMHQIVACTDELRLRRLRRDVEQKDAECVNRWMVLTLNEIGAPVLRETVRR